jgi:hypothetical protein
MSPASLAAVESAIASLPGIASVIVVDQSGGSADQRLVAYVTSGGADIDVSGLHVGARKMLSGPNMPAAIVVLDEIPVTADGTIDLQALPVPDLSCLMPYRAPDTARQEVLCSLFAEVLGVARCGVDDDFFSLGGKSVEAMLLAGRISDALDVRLSMADLFAAATVTELDQRLDVLANDPKQPIKARDSRPTMTPLA